MALKAALSHKVWYKCRASFSYPDILLKGLTLLLAQVLCQDLQVQVSLMTLVKKEPSSILQKHDNYIMPWTIIYCTHWGWQFLLPFFPKISFKILNVEFIYRPSLNFDYFHHLHVSWHSNFLHLFFFSWYFNSFPTSLFKQCNSLHLSQTHKLKSSSTKLKCPANISATFSTYTKTDTSNPFRSQIS